MVGVAGLRAWWGRGGHATRRRCGALMWRRDAMLIPTRLLVAAAGGVEWWTGGGMRLLAGGLVALLGTEADLTVGGGYHFRRHAVFPCVVCASGGLQSGNVCRVTRVGSRNPACGL